MPPEAPVTSAVGYPSVIQPSPFVRSGRRAPGRAIKTLRRELAPQRLSPRAGSARGGGAGESAEAPFALAEVGDGLLQVRRAELRPHHLKEAELGVGALPK